MGPIGTAMLLQSAVAVICSIVSAHSHTERAWHVPEYNQSLGGGTTKRPEPFKHALYPDFGQECVDAGWNRTADDYVRYCTSKRRFAQFCIRCDDEYKVYGFSCPKNYMCETFNVITGEPVPKQKYPPYQVNIPPADSPWSVMCIHEDEQEDDPSISEDDDGITTKEFRPTGRHSRLWTKVVLMGDSSDVQSTVTLSESTGGSSHGKQRGVWVFQKGDKTAPKIADFSIDIPQDVEPGYKVDVSFRPHKNLLVVSTSWGVSD